MFHITHFIIKRTIFAANLRRMIETIIITVIIVAICLALLAIKIILKKNGRFPNTHVSGSKAMRKRGIGCVQSQDREARAPKRIKVNERIKK